MGCWCHRLSRAVVQGVALGGVALMSWSWSPAAGASERLKITSALWKSEKSELRIEGRSQEIDGVVLVRDAATKKLIGSAAVRADGKWMLKIRGPNFVPRRTRVECEGAGDESAVQTVAVAVAAAAPVTAPPMATKAAPVPVPPVVAEVGATLAPQPVVEELAPVAVPPVVAEVGATPAPQPVVEELAPVAVPPVVAEVGVTLAPQMVVEAPMPAPQEVAEVFPFTVPVPQEVAGVFSVPLSVPQAVAEAAPARTPEGAAGPSR